MHITFPRSPIALAAVAALGAVTVAALPTPADARGKTQGTYMAGDFHNHTTCSDGAISMQKLVKKLDGTRATRPGAWTGSCKPATAAPATATARCPKTPRSRPPPTRRCSPPTA